jgi:hypothetical protein
MISGKARSPESTLPPGRMNCIAFMQADPSTSGNLSLTTSAWQGSNSKGVPSMFRSTHWAAFRQIKQSLSYMSTGISSLIVPIIDDPASLKLLPV